jgi:hypothetical protein
MVSLSRNLNRTMAPASLRTAASDNAARHSQEELCHTFAYLQGDLPRTSPWPITIKLPTFLRAGGKPHLDAAAQNMAE